MSRVNTTKKCRIVAYQVIKRIKGHYYLYEQRTYREGGKVRTESRYIGPASPADVQRYGRSKKADSSGHTPAAVDAPNTEHEPPSPAEIPRADENAAQRPESSVEPQGPPTRARAFGDASRVNTTNNPSSPAQSLDVQINLSKYKISERSLHAEHEAFVKRLRRVGLDTSAMPAIKLKHGGQVGHKKEVFGGSYVVTLPKHQRGQRTKFKDAFSKSLARAGLEVLCRQQPEKYLRLSEAFDESFRRTQEALDAYILYSADRNRRYKALALKWWGNVAQLRKNIPDPRKVGLVDYSRRKSWDDELVTVMAALQRGGLEPTIKKQRAQHAIAKREETAAFEDYHSYKGIMTLHPRRIKARKRWKRAVARVQTQEEMKRKITLIRQVFYSK